MTSLLLRKAHTATTGRVVAAIGRRCYLSTITPGLREVNPWLVDARSAPSGFTASSAVVYSDFISAGEADGLVQDLQESPLKRRRYEKGHWDAVIIKYKETELLDEASMLSAQSQRLLDRVRHQLKERHLSHKADDDSLQDPLWLPCHAIDLHKDGELQAHVDSVRFSGDIVAGLSLLSPSIMRLLPDDDKDDDPNKEGENDTSQGWVDLYLPPRSLYVLSGPARYSMSHQLLPTGSVFLEGGEEDHEGLPVTVHRDHRLSVIFRDTKSEDHP